MATGTRWIAWIGGGLIALLGVVATAGGASPSTRIDPHDANAPIPTSSSSQLARMPDAPTTVLGGSDAELALATSEALFEHAAITVLSDADAVSIASGIATRLGAPALLVPGTAAADAALDAELRRLGTSTIVAVGADAADWATTNRAAAELRDIVPSLESALLPSAKPSPRLAGLTAVSLSAESAAAATAAAAGARVVTLQSPDPRASAADIAALAGQPLDRILALGSAFGAPDGIRYRLEVAASGVELPGGGQLLFPGRHFVALYGHPGSPVLGVLGEQGIEASIARAESLAAEYQTAFGETAVPTFEIITTIASASAGPDGDYSDETPVEELRPWIEAAAAAGVYVVLDLQPGRTDFLTQAKRYESLLTYPNVGLALDPEWRLGPNQFHLKNVGHVDASEVNAVGAWLEALTESHRLPQKIFMIHQWLRSMLTDRQGLVTDYDALGVVIHVDGFGATGSKLQTWDAIRADAPAGVSWGWKNFIDEDQPMLTPEQTVAEVHPSPAFISYQ